MDDFHTGKAKIPINRHRIPTIGEEKVFNGSAAPKKLLPPGSSPERWIYDMDGRRHVKPKRPKAYRTNASQRKVDLPRINSYVPNNLVSPNSQPQNIG